MEFLVEPVDVDLLAYFDVDKLWSKKTCGGTYCEDLIGCAPYCTGGYQC